MPCNPEKEQPTKNNVYKETQPIKKPRKETKSEAIRRLQGE